MTRPDCIGFYAGIARHSSGYVVSVHQVTVARVSPFAYVRRRVAQGLGGVWPPGAPGRVLLALLVVGFLLRLLAVISLWPTTILEDGYQT